MATRIQAYTLDATSGGAMTEPDLDMPQLPEPIGMRAPAGYQPTHWMLCPNQPQ